MPPAEDTSTKDVLLSTIRPSGLPDEVRTAAHIATNGEVSWRLSDAPAAISALADAGHVVLGLDTQTHHEDEA